MKPVPKPSVAKQIDAARLAILEFALVALTEDLDNRVPSDPEILEHGLHVAFSTTPLSVYRKGGKEFSRYFVWRRKHAVAIGFLDENDPITLSIVRVPPDEWPTALKLYVEQK